MNSNTPPRWLRPRFPCLPRRRTRHRKRPLRPWLFRGPISLPCGRRRPAVASRAVIQRRPRTQAGLGGYVPRTRKDDDDRDDDDDDDDIVVFVVVA